MPGGSSLLCLGSDGPEPLISRILDGVFCKVKVEPSSLISSFARNPSLKGQLFSYTILGFALTEAIALFALMMAFLILFA